MYGYQSAHHAPHVCTVYVPVVCVPTCCGGGWPIKVPHSIEVQPGETESVIIGGAAEVSLAVEYLIEPGAAAPAVKVTTSFAGVDSTWSATDVAPGYHVQEAALSAKPGSKTTLNATDAFARIRWCETICC